MINFLDVKNRDELRQWLMDNHDTAKECWVVVKRGRPVDDDTFWYIDAVQDYALEERHIRKIDVNEQNDEAYCFYLRRGYKVIGRDEKDADGKPYPIVHWNGIIDV